MKENLVAGIKVDGQVMREFRGDIFIPFGTNYSIFFKNLNTRSVQIYVEIDGEDILDGNSLIVSPGGELNLERWLNGGMKKGPKLKFVEKTNDIRMTKEETGMDGIVKITYQFERAQQWTYIEPWHYIEQYITPSHIFYSSSPGASAEPYGATRNISANFTQDVKATSSVEVSAQNEDGLTVKGEEVKQEFRDGYIGYLEDAKHVICFNLKGAFKRAVTVKSKIKCNKCNKINKSSFKFCSQCGNNLKYN